MHDSIPSGTVVRKAIYQEEFKEHNSFYNWLWGKHYRKLYYQPVSVKSGNLNTLFGGLALDRQMPQLRGLLMEDKNDKKYLLKPLGGASSFMQSDFFRSVYDQEDFKDTYLGDFVKEAYTIQHPYTFIVADILARDAGLVSGEPHIYYINDCTPADTLSDGTLINNHLVSIYEIPDLSTDMVIDSIEPLIRKLHADSRYKLDMDEYLLTRLFDIVIGDWNKIPANWAWIGNNINDEDSTIVFEPYVIDRSHAFTRVDGAVFQQLLNILGLNFVRSYNDDLKNVKRFNTLAYPIDMAFTAGCREEDWLKQAGILQERLTDENIDKAFSALPEEMKGENMNILAHNLKIRRDKLPQMASRYYWELQKTPVITGTEKDDRIIIQNDPEKNTRIIIYDNADSLKFDKTYYHKHTKEIWVYGLEGNDRIESYGRNTSFPILVIGGKGTNNYQVEDGKKLKIYEYKEEKTRLDSVSGVKFIFPGNEEKTLAYDYTHLYRTEWTFTPIGIYDSDLGLNLGTSVAYTIYGFRRAPYTQRHQLSFDYKNGFTYQGIFPDYDGRKRFHISAYAGTPAYFYNFFGFGNETSGYKDEDKKYNRVYIQKFSVAPALYYTISKFSEVNLTSSFESYHLKNPDGRNRFINTVYPDGSSIFDTKFFVDLNAGYTFDKRMKMFLSRINFDITSGWVVNLGEARRNFPYVVADLGFNFAITRRITLATILKGRALFTDKYEFFQAATTELRGFRDNRFIGKQSFYQYTDIRYDMGNLDNPLAPLKYGVFLGTDYGRVWYPDEESKKWHSSYGGGLWLTIFKNFTGKFSYFASKDTGRFMIELGMGF